MAPKELDEFFKNDNIALVRKVEITSVATNGYVAFSLWRVTNRKEFDNHVLTIVKILNNENVGPGSAANNVYDVHLPDGASGWMTANEGTKRLFALVTNHMLL